MAKSFAAEKKAGIVALLKQHHADRYALFRFKTRSWSTGCDVEVIWQDGPAYNALQKLLQDYYKDMFSLTRRYSRAFIERVATEYCQVKRCDVPSIIPLSNGYWMDVDYSKDLPYKEISLEMRKLDERDLPTLAYRASVIDGVRTPIQSVIVRRKDYSHGKYPHLAIVREHSYTHFERKLFKVRRRINANWVEVVYLDSLGLMDNGYALEKHIEFCKLYGREY